MMQRLMRWAVPDGVFWTRADRIAVLVDEIRVFWLYSRELMAQLNATVARMNGETVARAKGLR